MKRPDRSVQIFSLSALDILAMATGAFVVMVTLMLPYYQRVLEAEAETEDVRAAEQTSKAELAAIEEETAATQTQTGKIVSESEAAAARNAALDEQIAEITKKIGKLESAAARPQAPKAARRPLQSTVQDRLDVVFVVDTTKSMAPSLRNLALSLRGIVRVLEKLVPSLRVGVVAYTDRDTGYTPVQALSLTETSSGLPRVLRFVENLTPPPRGSRTIDEDMELGLAQALSMPWRRDAVNVIVVIGDAQPHRKDRGHTLGLANRFRSSGPQNAISSLFVSTRSSRRAGDAARPFFRRLAQAGGGSFNQHSGQMFESVIMSVIVK